jgi:hypothetical protein
LSQHATEEMLNDNIELGKVLETLEEGVETGEKRKPGVMEFVKGFKKEMLKAVVADAGDNWRIVTVMRFRR